MRRSLGATLAILWLAEPGLLAGTADFVTRDAAPAAVAIQRARVQSSSLASIGHHREAGVLEIEFRSGAIYRYFGVPRVVFERLVRAPSKGRHFARHIRGRYKFERMDARVP